MHLSTQKPVVFYKRGFEVDFFCLVILKGFDPIGLPMMDVPKNETYGNINLIAFDGNASRLGWDRWFVWTISRFSMTAAA